MQWTAYRLLANNGVDAAFHSAGAAIITFVLYLRQWSVRVCGTHLWSPHWAAQSLSRLDHTGQASRDGVALRQWFRTNVGAGGERVAGAVGDPVPAAGDQDWRYYRDGVVCRLGLPRRVSVQRGRATRRARWVTTRSTRPTTGPQRRAACCSRYSTKPLLFGDAPLRERPLLNVELQGRLKTCPTMAQ